MYERTRARGFGAEVKRRIMLGTYALSSGYYEAYYGQAQQGPDAGSRRTSTRAFARFDFLVTPTSPTVAFELGAKTADPWAMYMNDYCTVPMPLGGHPGDLDPFRTGRAGRRRSGAPGRLPDHRSRILRVGDPRRRLRVRASDRLHRTAGRVMSVEETEAAMREALDALPGWVLDELGEVAVIVEDSHPEGLMGIYDPVGGLQRVVVFRNANPNADEVKRTVLARDRAPLRDERAADRQPGIWMSGVLPDKYEAVIGLEIHVQLKTRTKMFCGCELSFGDDPNIHTCAVCLAHPGSLPVINEQAVRYGIQIGLALGCEIAPRSIFHRKNYFYPDNPKAYQISQYDIPLATAGRLGDVRIHRVHLEEDAAKLVHVGESGRIHGSGALARRLQPGRDAAGRDRHRAGSARPRGGARVAPAPAHHDQGDRRLGREHGGGEPPL